MAEPENQPEKKDPAPPAAAAPSREPLPSEAQAAASTAPAPAGEPAKAALQPRKKWVQAPPATGNKWVWRLVFVATFVAMLLLGVIVLLLVNTNKAGDTPRLAAEFKDTVNNNYAICPPENWVLLDPHDGRNFNILGPRERGFAPLIQICFDVAPGHLDSYLKEFEARELSGVKIESSTREKLDGHETARLVYTWDTTDDVTKKPVTVKTVQYILEDIPRFYRVTCSVGADRYEKYQARFEASVKTFKILPIKDGPPKILSPAD